MNRKSLVAIKSGRQVLVVFMWNHPTIINVGVLNQRIMQVMQRVNWEGSKHLNYGSLLLLLADNFNSFMLFTVVERKPKQLSRGLIKTKFQGKSLYQRMPVKQI